MANNKVCKKELLVIPMLFVLTLVVIVVTYHASHVQTVVINEVCSNNFSILQNSSGAYTDYIELYNASDTGVSLSGWTLGTDNSTLGLYTFGDVVLDPHAYLLLINNDTAESYRDAEPLIVEGSSPTVITLEFPCTISKNGGMVYLRNALQMTVDAIDIPALRQDTVYARNTDAGTEWDILSPSPGIDNANSTPRTAPTNNEPVFTADALSLPLAEYSEFPVISISMSEEDIWGTSGIFLPENRNLSGRMAERPCHIDYFSAGMNFEFSEEAGIRIASRSDSLNYPDFNLYARSQDLFPYSFFDKGLSYHKLELNHASSSEYLMCSLLEKDGLCSTSLLPCTVFLNGEFFGEYYLAEPLDEQTLADVHNMEADNITVLKDGQLETGSEYALLEYRNLVQTCAYQGFDDETFSYFCSVVDIDSLVDYYAVQLFLNNLECTPYQNCFVWRCETTDSANPYADGKWHYEVIGLKDAMPSSRSQGDDLWLMARFIERDPIFYPLLQNLTFRDMLSARMHALAFGTFSEENISAQLADSPDFYGSTATAYEEFLLFFEERSATFMNSFDDLIASDYL